MKRAALQKARVHLQLASEAVVRLRKSSNFLDYENSWVEFLAQATRIYSKLEQGAKGCNQSEYWFGLRKSERKTDPLLLYIRHARDTEEHSIEFSSAIATDGVISQMRAGHGARLSAMVMIDHNGQLHVRDVESKDDTGTDLPFEISNPRPSLLQVRKPRSGDIFDPPVMHLSQLIVDLSPLGIASLALKYFDAMIADAAGLPIRP